MRVVLLKETKWEIKDYFPVVKGVQGVNHLLKSEGLDSLMISGVMATLAPVDKESSDLETF